MARLDIIPDPVCPWCYIGKANLDRAPEAHPAHPFAIEWHPFQLNPDMPAGGMDRAMIAHLLAGSADVRNIRDRDGHARRRGVTGVPCFVIASQHVVSGAQPPELRARVISDLPTAQGDSG